MEPKTIGCAATMLLLACGGSDDGGDGSVAGSPGATASASGGTGAAAGAGGAPRGGAGGGGAGGSGANGSGGSPIETEYQGFGALTKGHQSCPDAPIEVHVTSLEDSGPGTLREAFEGGCRHIVFDLGGTIVLESDLNLPYSYVTVDGSTAPPPGITIEQGGALGTTIEASNSIGPVHDIVIRYLRMDGKAMSHLDEGDIWGLDGEAALVSAIVVDHVTAIASADGVFDAWEAVEDVTLSHNLILDTVAALHLSTNDLGHARQRFSVHKNVFARNNERQIRLRHNSVMIDYVNNVVYGWGWMEGGAAGLHVAYDAAEINPSVNVRANVFHFVPGLSGDAGDAIKFERGSDEGDVFFADNVLPAGEADDQSSGPELSIPPDAQLTVEAPASLATSVVPHAGTHYPTAGEAALLEQIAADIQ